MIAGIILAAGQPKHVGSARPLLVHDQAAVLDTVARNFRASALDDVITVVGYEARRIVQRISTQGLKVIINGQFRMGLSSSLQRGLAYIPPRCRAVMIALGDMPLVSPATINTLAGEHRKGKKGITVPVHAKQYGHPVVIDMKYLEFLLGLRGELGAHAALEAFPKDVREVKITSDEVLRDVDTHDDFERIRPLLNQPARIPALA